MSQFVEMATGHVSNRSQVVNITNLNQYVFNEPTEVYHSWYTFDEQLKTHIDNVGTIQGFNGVYSVENIILDYDKKELTDEELYQAVRWLVAEDMINNIGIHTEDITIWYSGNGFHIELPNIFGFTPSTSLPSVVKETLQAIFPECDNIYDGARLIRMGGSYNTKTGRYKIPFTVDDFLSTPMVGIITMAEHSPELVQNFLTNQRRKVTPYLEHLVKQPSIVPEAQTVRSQFRIDPNSVVTCMQTALANPPVVGERNETMMRIASWMRRCGMPQTTVIETLTKWSGLQREAQSCVEKIFENGYEYGCKDGIMSKWCKPNCIYFKHKDYNMNIMNVDDMAEKYVEFLQKDFTKSAFNFADVYSLHADYWVLPGELVMVTGNTGMGKSTFVMNLVANLPKLNTLFLSLENTWHLTYRRFVQITHGKSKTDVIKEAKAGVETMYHNAFKHIQIVCEAPELSRLTDAVARSQPKLVVVDTTDEINVNGTTEEFSKMNQIIGGLKAIATNQDCIVIAVHHVNKQAEQEGFVNMSHLKGTSNTYQKADKVLTINAPENSRDTLKRMLKAEKSRDEGHMQLMFEFNKSTMQFNQLNDGILEVA